MKSVIVTGTSKGIGLETALAFGRAGYKVYATMRNTASAESLRKVIKTESLPISISAMDVDSDESVKKGIDAILKENGGIDVLVNNAGIEFHGSVEEMEMEKFKSVMETNYFGAIRCIKAVLPGMRKKQSGCIINVASVAGHISGPPLGPYTASKFALEAISEVLAGEVKPFNIHVAIVEPGIINTQMASDIAIADHAIYGHARRFAGLFSAALKNPVQPTLVGDKMVEIAESGTWKLRHPVGPDAQPFLDWRKSMTDEQWVDWNAANDEDWYKAVESTFGLNARAEATGVSLKA